MNQEFPDVQAGFRKGRGTRGQIANISWIIKKAREFRETSSSVSLTMLKHLTVWITTNGGKFLNRWHTRPPNLLPEKPAYRSRSNSENRTWNNRLVPNWERSTSRLYIFTLLI